MLYSGRFIIAFQTDYENESSASIVSKVIPAVSGNMYGEIQLLGALLKREGEYYVVEREENGAEVTGKMKVGSSDINLSVC